MEVPVSGVAGISLDVDHKDSLRPAIIYTGGVFDNGKVTWGALVVLTRIRFAALSPPNKPELANSCCTCHSYIPFVKSSASLFVRPWRQCKPQRMFQQSHWWIGGYIRIMIKGNGSRVDNLSTQFVNCLTVHTAPQTI